MHVICSGNRFRSPLVAAALREATKGLPVGVGSAGTLDLGGLPPLDGATRAAAELGLDLAAHRSRFLGSVDLSDADLVLGFERMHVTTAVVDAHAPRERTFTLPELVALLEALPPSGETDVVARARESIAAAHRARLARGQDLALAEVDDPIGTSARVQRETADALIDLTSRLALELFGVRLELAGAPTAGRRGSRWPLRFRGR